MDERRRRWFMPWRWKWQAWRTLLWFGLPLLAYAWWWTFLAICARLDQ